MKEKVVQKMATLVKNAERYREHYRRLFMDAVNAEYDRRGDVPFSVDKLNDNDNAAIDAGIKAVLDAATMIGFGEEYNRVMYGEEPGMESVGEGV